MKSSKTVQRPQNSSKVMFLSNGPVYSLLVLYMPMTVLTAMVFLLKAFLPAFITPAPLLISGALGALAASFYCDLMKDNKSSHTFANIRGGLIIMVVFYGLSSLSILGVPWKTRFLPNLTNVLVTVGTLYMWVSVISLKQLFSARRCFETYTELYQGEELQKAILEDSSMMQYTGERIVNARRKYLSQLVFISVITFAGVVVNIHLPPAFYLLLVVILAGGICIFGFFGIIRWEQYYAGEGMSLSVADRFQRMIGIGIFTVFSITAAIFLASDKSLLSFSLITGFLAWLLKLLRRISPAGRTPEAVNFESIEMEPAVSISENLLAVETSTWPIWKWLQYGLVVIAAAFLIWFLISPLFDRIRYSEKLSFLRRLGRIIAEWFKGVMYALALIAESFKNGKRLRKLRRPGAGEIRRTADTILGAYSAAKRQDMRRSVTLFARLIIWGGEARYVSWKPAYAPGEYCGILAASEPPAVEDEFALKRQNEGIIRCGELFEQALYSAEVLSEAERKEFKDLVEGLGA